MQCINIVLNNFKNDSRVLKTSIFLKKIGFDVTVVAMHEPGIKEHDVVGGLPVHRINLKSRGWSKSKAIQLLKYFEYVYRFLKSYRKVDIIHCNDLNALPIGVLVKLFNRRCKVVYDAHEYEINDVPNQGYLSIKFKYFLEKLFIRYADQVITVSDSIAEEYKRLYAIPKPHLVLNCPGYTEQAPKNLFRESLAIRRDQKIFLYQGGLSEGRGIEILLKAFETLASDENVLVCMGYGPLEAMIKEKALVTGTIFFHTAVSPDVLLNYTSSADFGISFIEDSCLSYRYCLPNKVFEYLMAGIPVLTSNLFEMKNLVEGYRVGIVAQTNSVMGFSEAVQSSLQQDYFAIVSNVHEARKQFCWEEQEKVLSEVYSEFK